MKIEQIIEQTFDSAETIVGFLCTIVESKTNKIISSVELTKENIELNLFIPDDLQLQDLGLTDAEAEIKELDLTYKKVIEPVMPMSYELSGYDSDDHDDDDDLRAKKFDNVTKITHGIGALIEKEINLETGNYSVGYRTLTTISDSQYYIFTLTFKKADYLDAIHQRIEKLRASSVKMTVGQGIFKKMGVPTLTQSEVKNSPSPK
jgi:hypothetical protein